MACSTGAGVLRDYWSTVIASKGGRGTLVRPIVASHSVVPPLDMRTIVCTLLGAIPARWEGNQTGECNPARRQRTHQRFCHLLSCWHSGASCADISGICTSRAKLFGFSFLWV